MWLGYLEEYPDYMTQGETIGELQDNLRDIYKELESGKSEKFKGLREPKRNSVAKWIGKY